MASRLLDMWGCARGPVTRLAPQARLVGGVVVLVACMICPVVTWPGALFVFVAVVAWLGLCRPPARLVGTLLLLGLALFSPAFLLVPWLPGRASGLARLAVPWGLLARGMAGMFVSVATIATLRPADLHDALAALPLPRPLPALLAQIVTQLGNLGEETSRIAAAMAARGATGGGRAARRVLVSLPSIWLPRVVLRAERVGDAMEVRGYGVELPRFRETPWRGPESLLLASSLAGLAVAVALRLLEGWG